MKEHFASWLSDAGYGEIIRVEALTGGCINNTARLHLDRGLSVILKYNVSAPAELFRAEAAGLAALSQRQAVRVPKVLRVAAHYLILEDLGCASPGTDYWRLLGAGLAALHGEPAEAFGFTEDNYCGATTQSNPITRDGHQFFAEQRIMALAMQCLDEGKMPKESVRQLRQISDRLDIWIPDFAPVLIQGDLWIGNTHCCADGQPALIDPAVYWGWAEADLAMTALFGGFPVAFYQSYYDNSEITSDWQERMPLYNLYPLLNHLLLFAGSHLRDITEICQRFA